MTVLQARAGCSGNGCRQFRTQPQRFIRHQSNNVSAVDGTSGLERVHALDPRWGDLFKTPESEDASQRFSQFLVALHLLRIEISHARGGLQGHHARR